MTIQAFGYIAYGTICVVLATGFFWLAARSHDEPGTPLASASTVPTNGIYPTLVPNRPDITTGIYRYSGAYIHQSWSPGQTEAPGEWRYAIEGKDVTLQEFKEWLKTQPVDQQDRYSRFLTPGSAGSPSKPEQEN